jgi:sugar phosphate isomerase/epimerase
VAWSRQRRGRCGDGCAVPWNFTETPDGRVLQGPAPSFGGQINYETFVDALQEVGYTGYLSSEYCVAVVKNHQLAGIEEVDRGTSLALR